MITTIMCQGFMFMFILIFTTEVTKAQDDVELCLESQDCWVEYNFMYDSTWNTCHGKRYISRTQYPEAPFLGVILCTNTRYKLFLSTAPWEEFLNIADSSGLGQDHCELVGGSKDDAILPNDYWKTPSITGFYRRKSGESFHQGPIGYGPLDGSAWTGNYYPKWYECGVTIPGENKVLLVAVVEISDGCLWTNCSYPGNYMYCAASCHYPVA